MRSLCVVVALLLVLAGCTADDSGGSAAGTSGPPAAGGDAARITDLIRGKVAAAGVTGAVFGVWRGDEQIVLGALGDSPVGVPAAADQRVRVGQPMEPMLSTVLFQLEREGVLALDEPIARWLPDFPRAAAITPRMLADSTSGVADYVTDPEFLRRFAANPIRPYTARELLDLANSRPPLFEPGTGWSYAHSDLVLLGEVLQHASGKPLGELIAQRITGPLGMADSAVVLTSEIAAPYLHGYTTERAVFEDSTFWNPTAFLHSGNMNAPVADIGRWVRALGTGELLEPAQFEAMMGPSTAGLGPFTTERYFAFGVVHLGEWLYMNPSYGGYDGVALYDTTSRTTVVVYTTDGPASDGNANSAIPIGTAVAGALVPERPPRLP
ncbi:serine hydrolase domain-containing protein [Nocardia asteroides]|uniref:serine hydrolase domain-containing protein n=1 Tax=Nocardia asteroides TaxID=1824 RepID=UPI001E4EAFB5|nr:serine hydrolase domain-containing protein [Nocardia asteroides]UGT62719.1 beta-lactamase family protein [Nocardia asteroides]